MEEFSNSRNEKSCNVINCIQNLLLNAHWSNSSCNFFSVFWHHQIWNFTGVQKIVEVFNKGLINNLCISDGK